MPTHIYLTCVTGHVVLHIDRVKLNQVRKNKNTVICGRTNFNLSNTLRFV